MRLAEKISELSTSRVQKVGAIAVYDDDILGFGYNHIPFKEYSPCEDIVEVDGIVELIMNEHVEHAERALIYSCANSGISLRGATLFTTHSPCINCARAILLSGITDVYWKYPHKTLDGVSFLKNYEDRVFIEQFRG